MKKTLFGYSTKEVDGIIQSKEDKKKQAQSRLDELSALIETMKADILAKRENQETVQSSLDDVEGLSETILQDAKAQSDEIIQKAQQVVSEKMDEFNLRSSEIIEAQNRLQQYEKVTRNQILDMLHEIRQNIDMVNRTSFIELGAQTEITEQDIERKVFETRNVVKFPKEKKIDATKTEVPVFKLL